MEENNGMSRRGVARLAGMASSAVAYSSGATMVTAGAQKGVAILPDRDKVTGQENFAGTRNGGRPRANIDVGLNDSATVMLTSKSVDEDRKVLWSELEGMQKA